jgi:hypothetical protein
MEFNYRYAGQSQVKSSVQATGMHFAPDTHREPTFFVGQLNKKIPFREAISALNAVVSSDLRWQPKDKTAYKAWIAQQEEVWLAKEMAGAADVSKRIDTIQEELNVLRSHKAEILQPYFKAQSHYFNHLRKTDMDAWYVLDPVITVHPDEVFFECFSQDESTYGKLSCGYEVFEHISEFAYGTTNVDYSQSLYNEFQKIRDYKQTDFRIDPSGFEVQTTNEETYKEVKIDLPDSWVRGFLQVSTAMTMPTAFFQLDPMDLFNICQFLRQNKARKSPRDMRFELKPGKLIEIVFEPWNHRIICQKSIYKGDVEKSIRLWGRRRLLVLERLIPIAQSITVNLLGSGMPSFYEVDLGDMRFTLGLSGWTANNWSQAANFDLLAPRNTADQTTQIQVFQALKTKKFTSVKSISQSLGLEASTVSSCLGAYTQVGLVIYDLGKGVYRLRELTKEPLPMDSLRFASPQEEAASRFLREGAVSIRLTQAEQDNHVWISGTVTGETKKYPVKMRLDGDTRIIEAKCNCNHYTQNKLRKGPCAHILAMRMAYLRKAE